MLHYHYASPSHYRSCSLSLTQTHAHTHILRNTMQRHTRMQECFPYTIFGDEMFAHCRSEIEKQNGRKMEGARDKESEFSLTSGYSPSPSLSLSAPYCV